MGPACRVLAGAGRERRRRWWLRLMLVVAPVWMRVSLLGRMRVLCRGRPWIMRRMMMMMMMMMFVGVMRRRWIRSRALVGSLEGMARWWIGRYIVRTRWWWPSMCCLTPHFLVCAWLSFGIRVAAGDTSLSGTGL